MKVRRATAVTALGVLALTGCSNSSTTSGSSGSATGASAGSSSSPRSDTPSSSSKAATSIGTPDPKACAASAADNPAARGENASVTPSSTGTDYGHPETDVRSENLDLHWDGTKFTGTSTITFAATKATSTISLDLAPQLTVSKVTLDGKEITATHPNHTLTMATGPLGAGRTGKLVITYSGVPHSVKAPSTRPDMSEGLGWVKRPDGSVTTYAEPYGTSTWAPVNESPDDKALYSATVTTKAPQVAIINGSLCSSSSKGGQNTSSWHAAEPMAAYLVTLNLGAYTAHDVTVQGRTITLYTQSDEEVENTKESLAWAYAWLTKRLGAYPFRELGLVSTNGGSGMETQGLITIDRKTLMTQNRAVVLHEMAHQWFGDAVTPRAWRDLWLNEGMAMFVQLQGAPPLGATDDDVVRSCDTGVATEGQVGSPKPNHFGEDTPYMCGALLFSELRDQVGDAEFWKAMGGWPRSRMLGNGSREEFATYWQKTTGKDPRRILAKWLDTVSAATTTSTHVIPPAMAGSSPDSAPATSGQAPPASSSH